MLELIHTGRDVWRQQAIFTSLLASEEVRALISRVKFTELIAFLDGNTRSSHDHLVQAFLESAISAADSIASVWLCSTSVPTLKKVLCDLKLELQEIACVSLSPLAAAVDKKIPKEEANGSPQDALYIWIARKESSSQYRFSNEYMRILTPKSDFAPKVYLLSCCFLSFF